MNKRGYYILSIIFIVLGLLSIGYYYTNSKHGGYGEELITTASKPLKIGLTEFLTDVDKSIFRFNSEIQSTNLSDLNPNKIDSLANTIITNDSYIRGVVLFTNKLKYVFLKDNDTRITTFTSAGDSLLNWIRLDKNLKKISEWTDTYNFFLNKKNRILLEHTPSDDGTIKWIKIKSEIPGRKDLTLQVHQLKAKDGIGISIAYIFQTDDFSGFFLNRLPMNNPMITILTQTGEVFTPLATEDSATNILIKKEEVELKKIFKTWRTSMNQNPHSFSFEIENIPFWTRIDTINNRLGVKAFSLTVSKANLAKAYAKITLLFVYAGLVLILSGFIILLIIWLKTRPAKLKEGELPEAHSVEDIKQLINQGESENIEFKSSLRYDYRQEKENSMLEDVIIKSIAAFSNAKGGTLFIGIDDNQNVLGLDNDFSTLKKSDVDYFELHLRKLIKNQFGINFSNHRLIIQFPQLENKIVCVIQITTAKKPIYVKMKNKHGQMVEKFYVRNGNSSQEITSLKEIEEYINNRFGKK